jgi:glycosyltransferase involved in cell wall biosynthesis
MRIAVLGTRGFPNVQGGVEKHCEELYPRLVKLGCDVTVFARTPYIVREKRIPEWKGIKFIYLWCPQTKSLEAITHTALGILKARTMSPDILHIHAIGPSLLAPLARAFGLNVIMTHHGPDYEREKWGDIAKSVLRRGEQAGVRYSNAIIAISKGITRHIENTFNKKARYIPNGVSMPTLEPPGDELARWELRPGQYVFTACRFVPEKGLLDLIEAYRAIISPPFKLVIAGDADHESDYSREVKKLSAATPGVVLTGFLSGKRLGELFSNAGLFVLPSYYEGLPIALLEALSYGLPVLVSDIPQHREIDLDESSYFSTGNRESLSEALLQAYNRGITDSEKRRYLSLVQNDYDWDAIATKVLNVFSEIVATS